MRRLTPALIALSLLAACSKSDQKPDNAATRYTEGLSQDAQAAQAAADKANAVIAERQNAAAEAQQQAE
jgi:outer membrane biogenesis lipoprotein LolB